MENNAFKIFNENSTSRLILHQMLFLMSMAVSG